MQEPADDGWSGPMPSARQKVFGGQREADQTAAETWGKTVGQGAVGQVINQVRGAVLGVRWLPLTTGWCLRVGQHSH